MKKIFEKYDLFKIVCLVILVTVVLTWIFKTPTMTSGLSLEDTIKRVGLIDLFLSGVNGLNFFSQQILIVLFIGIFYGIMSKVSGYSAFVKKIAKIFKGKEKVFVTLTSIIIALLTSSLTQVFIVVIFLPLIINISKELKIDKIVTMLATFGSVLVGIIGATVGTEGVKYFISYLVNWYGAEIDLKTMLGIRYGILAISVILYNFFMMLYMKQISKKKSEEEVEDMFVIANESKAKIWPLIVFYVIIFAFVILGYVNFKGIFDTDIFTDFHTKVTELAIGKYTILAYLIGSRAVAFGNWDLYMIIPVMCIMIILSAIIYRVKIDELIENGMNGLQKMVKPVVLMFLIYTVFVFIYWTPFTYTVSKPLIEGNFNPFLTAVSGFFCAIFHIDFGYTSYLMGELLVTNMANSINIAFVIYTAMNGLALVVAPTSIVLFVGLSYLNIPYVKWLKTIWKYALAMLVVLMGIFALLTYL